MGFLLGHTCLAKIGNTTDRGRQALRPQLWGKPIDYANVAELYSVLQGQLKWRYFYEAHPVVSRRE